jgi:hypothetical protein
MGKRIERRLSNFVTDEILEKFVFSNGLCCSIECDNENSCIYVTLGVKAAQEQIEMSRREMFIVTSDGSSIVVSRVEDFITRDGEFKFKNFYEFFDFVNNSLVLIARNRTL